MSWPASRLRSFRAFGPGLPGDGHARVPLVRADVDAEPQVRVEGRGVPVRQVRRQARADLVLHRDHRVAHRLRDLPEQVRVPGAAQPERERLQLRRRARQPGHQVLMPPHWVYRTTGPAAAQVALKFTGPATAPSTLKSTRIVP